MRLRYLIDSAMSALPALLLPPSAKSNGVEKPAAAAGTAPVVEPPIEAAPEPSHPFRPAPEPAAEEEPEPFLEPAAFPDAVDQPPVAAPAMALRAEAERPVAADVNLTAVAQLCTRLGRALAARDVAPVLADAARLLDAVGVILWMWDPRQSMLQPVFTHGYPDELVAGLPHVSGDTTRVSRALSLIHI